MDRNFGDKRKRSIATGRRRRLGAAGLAVAFALGTVWVGLQAQSTPDPCGPRLDAADATKRIELDRDATQVNCKDWDQVFADASTNPPGTSAGADAVSFDHDALIAAGGGKSVDGTQFTGGGTKDIWNITGPFTNSGGWKWSTGDPPDKDDILDAFAARYTNMLYFGADRTSNNGDAQIGFWFFQNAIAKVGTTGGGFSGEHKDGDILIISNFTGGGTTTDIIVYAWCSAEGGPTVCQRPVPGSNPPTTTTIGEVNGTLHLVAGLDQNGNPIQSNCQSSLDSKGNTVPAVLDGAPFCATVNTSPKPSPWTFIPKVGTAGNFATGEFYEGGIDLTFLGLQNECFASFLAETRSSQEANAVLKDFVLGSFQSCETGLTTTPSTTNTGSGTAIPGTGIKMPQSGTLTVYDKADLVVTGAGTWSGTLQFFLCGPTPLTDTDYTLCTEATGTQIGSTLNVTQATPQPIFSSGASITSIGRYCWLGKFDGTAPVPDDSDSAVTECFMVIPDTSTTTTAQDWLPNDTATVKLSDGTTNGSGKVKFALYLNGTCSGTAAANFNGGDGNGILLVNGQASTNNTAVRTTTTTISWRVTFLPDSTNVTGSTSGCETSTVTIDNVGTVP
jgi:hypothetical protein